MPESTRELTDDERALINDWEPRNPIRSPAASTRSPGVVPGGWNRWRRARRTRHRHGRRLRNLRQRTRVGADPSGTLVHCGVGGVARHCRGSRRREFRSGHGARSLGEPAVREPAGHVRSGRVGATPLDRTPSRVPRPAAFGGHEPCQVRDYPHAHGDEMRRLLLHHMPRRTSNTRSHRSDARLPVQWPDLTTYAQSPPGCVSSLPT
jgi:hypothetical protein